MKRIEKTANKLNIALEVFEIEIEDILKRAEKGIELSRKALKEIRKIIVSYQFKNNQEEIYFFKNIKPRVYCKLIYNVKLFNIESKRPRGSNKSQVKYFNNQIDKLQNYFDDNLEFYHYYRRGATVLDEHYFIRGKSDIRLFSDSHYFYTDEEFSTNHDSTVATILAYDMLIIYLKKEIDKLENNNGIKPMINQNQKKSPLFWTANKTDLIELIYALDSIKAINSGTADIKKMAIACERLFNIELGDYYRTYLEIRSRKINQTKFLDNLKESLLTRMDNAYE